MTDPIADFLTRIRNAVSVGHKVVEIPGSKIKLEMTKILKEKGYETKDGLGNYIFIKTKKAPKELEKELKEERKILIKTFGNPMLSEYIRVSTGSKNAMEFFVENFLDVDE